MLYGQSEVFPVVYGEHTHLFTFDTDPGVRALQIYLMKLRGTQSVRDNFITGPAKYRLAEPSTAADLLTFYTESLCPDFLANDIIPQAVLADRNWTGDWRSTTSPPATLTNSERAEVVAYIAALTPTITDDDRVFDYANRMILNLAIFGSDSGSFCSDLRTWFLDEIETMAAACPLGTWFQLFNGPETTRVCGQFGNVPWDYTPDSMHTVDPANSNPAANRSWALNTFTPEVTMPTVEQDYIDLEEAFWADAREKVREAGHPPERLLFWGIHSYVLATSTGLVRSLGAPDPLDFTTIPDNAVFTEFGVGRYPDVALNNASVLPRPFREHVSRILATTPRAMYLHTPIDSRRYGQWEIVGGTLELWTELMYKEWLLDPPGRNPLANVAYHLLEDEPYLYEEMLDAARRFGDLQRVRTLP